MSYEQALALAGPLPSWELRAAVQSAFICPKLTSAHERRFALAARTVLHWRERGFGGPTL